MGLVLVIVGNYLPKCHQSYTVGIKLPWTLNNEENWAKTHRLAGKVWVVCGLAVIVAGFLKFFPVMIAAALLGVPFGQAFLICLVGNLLPIPFILWLIRPFFNWLRTVKHFKKLADWLERKTEKNKEKVMKYEVLGLLLFVAIPLPGTGGWTGALVAAMLDMPIKKSLPIICLGVLIAGGIMAAVTYGLPALF